jgi:hypothetical protein
MAFLDNKNAIKRWCVWFVDSVVNQWFRILEMCYTPIAGV